MPACLSHHFKECLWDVGGGEEAEAFEFYYHAGLAEDFGHAALYALELAVGDADAVVEAVGNVVLGDVDDVVVVNAHQADEVVHLAGGDDEGRVLAAAEVLTVVVDVGDGGQAGGVVDELLGLLAVGIDKDGVGDEGLPHLAALALHELHDLPLRKECAEALTVKVVLDALGPEVGCAEHIPRLALPFVFAFTWDRDVLYRYPQRIVLPGGRDRLLTVTGRWVAAEKFGHS